MQLQEPSITAPVWFLFPYSWSGTVSTLFCIVQEYCNIVCVMEEKEKGKNSVEEEGWKRRDRYLLLGVKLLELELVVLQLEELVWNQGGLRGAKILLYCIYFQSVIICCGKTACNSLENLCIKDVPEAPRSTERHRGKKIRKFILIFQLCFKMVLLRFHSVWYWSSHVTLRFFYIMTCYWKIALSQLLCKFNHSSAL